MSESSGHLSAKARIEEWLEAEGISFEEVADLNSYFHIQANLRNVSIHISESKVRRGVLAVQGILDLAEDQLFKIGKISSEENDLLFRLLFASLDKTEYLFLLQKDFKAKNWLKIQRTLYVDELTRTDLLREMKDLNIKLVNINYVVNESLEKLPSASNGQLYE
ncbi:MAG: DUF2299 family protein [Nitrososphaerota archaeon]|jgi:hypothetical protein|nr:DUF2299 family protein [Nitrososphaerota archaeon]